MWQHQGQPARHWMWLGGGTRLTTFLIVRSARERVRRVIFRVSARDGRTMALAVSLRWVSAARSMMSEALVIGPLFLDRDTFVNLAIF